MSCNGNTENTDNEESADSRAKTMGIGIVLTDKTVLRLDPTIYSAVVTYLKKGAEIKILEKSSKKTWLGNNEYYWYKVRFSRGYTGWIYGNNVKIFTEDEKDQVKRFLNRFWKNEHSKFVAGIKGRWRTIRVNSQYPEQFVEILDEEHYKSYVMEKDAAINIHEGEYNINYTDNEIIFQNGAFFGNKLIFLERENRLFMVKDKTDDIIRFTRIARFK